MRSSATCARRSLLTAGLVAFAGIFHGYAYAESIFGAEPTPLYAYLAGFAIIQFVDRLCRRVGVRALAEAIRRTGDDRMRVAGGAMVGVAMVAISGMLFPVSWLRSDQLRSGAIGPSAAPLAIVRDDRM